MSHDGNSIDCGREEGELNKVGFWIFVRGEFGLLGRVFGRLLRLEDGGGYGGKLSRELLELDLILIMSFGLLISCYSCGIGIY